MKKLTVEKPRFLTYWALGLLAITTLGLYANSLTNPFVLDDYVKIVHNPDIRNLSHIGETLVYPYEAAPSRNRNDPSRPLVYFIYSVIYHFWVENTVPYHVVNTAIHFCNSVLVYLLVNILLDSEILGLIMALMFLFLPIQAGVVIYVYSLSDLLCGFFVLLAFYLYLRGRKLVDRSLILNPFLVLSSYVFALASKQTGVSVVLIIGLYEMVFSKSPNIFRRFSTTLMILVGVTLAYLGFRYFYLGGLGDLEGFQQIRNGWNYFLIEGWVILKYIQLTFIPVGLTIDHGVMTNDFSGDVLGFCWFLVVSLGLIGLKLGLSLRSEVKLMGFGILFYLLVVLPVSIFPTVDCLVERRVYLANFGWLLFLAAICVRMDLKFDLNFRNFRKGIFRKLILISLFFFYFITSFKRNEVFAAEQTIWEECLAIYPGYSRAMTNLAWALVIKKEYDRGEVLLNSVLSFMPRNTEIYAKLGTLYGLGDFRKRDPEISLAYYQKAVEIDPDYYIGRFLAGELLMQLHRLPQAKEMLQKTIEVNKYYSPAYVLLGRIATQENNPQLAESYFNKAREIDPEGKAF